MRIAEIDAFIKLEIAAAEAIRDERPQRKTLLPKTDVVFQSLLAKCGARG